jgi:ABC-type lipoprotein export system ATPase subunit
MTILDVRALTSRSTLPNGRPVLAGVTAQARPGNITAIIGPSGAGKSTFLDLVTGITVPAGGSVSLGSASMHPAPARRRARQRAQLFASARQADDLIDALTVEENVFLGQRLSRRRDERLAERVFARLGLDHDVRRTGVQHLSGGQRRRLALARTVASGTPAIACDEPTTALDHDSADLVRGVLVEAARAGRTVLVVTHDPDLASHADHVIQLTAGRITATVDSPDPHAIRQLMCCPS